MLKRLSLHGFNHFYKMKRLFRRRNVVPSFRKKWSQMNLKFRQPDFPAEQCMEMSGKTLSFCSTVRHIVQRIELPWLYTENIRWNKGRTYTDMEIHEIAPHVPKTVSILYTLLFHVFVHVFRYIWVSQKLYICVRIGTKGVLHNENGELKKKVIERAASFSSCSSFLATACFWKKKKNTGHQHYHNVLSGCTSETYFNVCRHQVKCLLWRQQDQSTTDSTTQCRLWNTWKR